MFNRALFNRAAYNRFTSDSDVVTYNTVLYADFLQESELTSHLEYGFTAGTTVQTSVDGNAGTLEVIELEAEVLNNTQGYAQYAHIEQAGAALLVNANIYMKYALDIPGAAKVNGELYCAAGEFNSMDADTNISAEATGASDLVTIANLDAAVHAEADGCADYRAVISEQWEYVADVVLILNYRDKTQSSGAVGGTINLGIDYSAAKEFANSYGTINCYISPQAASDHIFEVAVSLPPGAVLEIDSDNFTVKLNGENVLYAQSGEWIFVSRDTQQISLDVTSWNAGTRLRGEMAYRERYL